MIAEVTIVFDNGGAVVGEVLGVVKDLEAGLNGMTEWIKDWLLVISDDDGQRWSWTR